MPDSSIGGFVIGESPIGGAFFNYGYLQNRIADELGDRQDLLSPLSDETGLLSPIQYAILSAIARRERERFYFNELLVDTPLNGNGAFNTVRGQEYYAGGDYAALPNIAKIDKLWVLIASQRYYLQPRTAQYLIDISVNQASLSMPTDWSYQAQQLRFYPIPDNAYPVGIYGTQRFTPLENPTDSNAWTEDAADLIRCEAKLILAREVLYDRELEVAATKAVHGDPEIPGDTGYLGALRAETNRRRGQSRIRPTYF